MDKWVLTVGTNCLDAAQEKEFNDWYDNIHLPDVLETPGFTGAVRYENPNPAEGEAKYLALYQIETDDIDETMKQSGENLGKKREAGRISPLLQLASRGLYKQIGSLYK
ncbi:hypothetical protein ACFLYN_02605 [Chloroflexota bacterium]